MWQLYVIAPFVALLPQRWRRTLPFHDAVPWHFASVVSGLAEFAIAVYALIAWYSYSVTTWVSRLLDNAFRHAGPVEVTDHEVGFGALLIVATHPLTWVLAYFAVEGMVRLCAPFTDTVIGVLPLYLTERLYAKIRNQKDPRPFGAPEFTQNNFSSYVSTLRERALASRLPAVPDELRITTVAMDEFLEIRSSHAKFDWDPPRVVRFGERYYRLEESCRSSVPRPYIYKLRRLSAGVPGRTVIVYQPERDPVIASP